MHRPSYTTYRWILHEVFGFAGSVAALLTISDVTQLAVLKHRLHFDDSAPAACQYLLTFAASVLGNSLYTPSCSAYMVQAVRLHGIFKGTFMGLARIARCQHWFFLGGQDPVPERFNWNEIKKGYTIFRKHRLHKHGTEPDPDGQETPFTPPDDCLD